MSREWPAAPSRANTERCSAFRCSSLGRKKLIVAGITTEICVLFPVLQMLDEGYEVQVAADASASYTKYGDDLALRRMERAGAVIMTHDQLISELAVDWSTPLGQRLSGILAYH